MSDKTRNRTMNNTPDPTDLNRDDYRATYCPEDNKIRLYTDRVERSTYLWLRSLKFSATPKQDCSFVATWSPAAEDAALAMIHEGDDIGDEDQGPEDRAADRAERFAMYREKRRAEAHGHADTYEAGPSAYGAQDGGRAERQAARRDRIGGKACTQWSKAEYWQRRTAGVITHALHRSSARVRRGRILRLEADQRKHMAEIEKAQARYDTWLAVLNEADPDKAQRLAYAAANAPGGGWFYKHPRTGRESSLYAHMIDAADPITGHEAARLAIGDRERPKPGRWADHYRLRLAYERQMLEAEGGTAADEDMKPGGLWRGALIVKVNKSPATGAVVSVHVHAPDDSGRWDYRRRGDLLRLNVQRDGQGIYTPPTPETLAQLAEVKGKAKAKTKKANAAAPKLINPTPEDAQRLQDMLNASHEWWRGRPGQVVKMTQAEYTAASKGTYSRCSTEYVHTTPRGVCVDRATMIRGGQNCDTTTHCKIRTGSRGDVVVITDKPKKPLPWGSINADIEARRDTAAILPKLPALNDALKQATFYDKLDAENAETLRQARYHGLISTSSLTQWSWSEKAAEAIREANAVTA